MVHPFSTSVSSPVARTALDALQAKQSALSAGYPMVVERQDLYKELLERSADGLWKTAHTRSNAVLGEDDDDDDDDEDTTLNRKPHRVVQRQTPLVNAGYAARVIAVSHAISFFWKFRRAMIMSSSRDGDNDDDNWDDNDFQAQIVLLGCGADVIGLWAAELAKKDYRGNLPSLRRIRIVEVDTPDVCAMKLAILTHSAGNDDEAIRNPLVYNMTEQTTTNDNVYYHGKLGPSQNAGALFDYLLVPADLTTDLDRLEDVLDLKRKDNPDFKSIPTLVLSELVLSYLPPVATDALLAWCATRLCLGPGSALIALEPLGFEPSPSQHASCISVAEGYRRDYCKNFQNKMERGMAKRVGSDAGGQNESGCGTNNNNNNNSSSSSASFHPIGNSKDDVLNRLVKAGFGVSGGTSLSSVTTLGVASSIAAAARSNKSGVVVARPWICPDIFDEHAALVLHLQSYILAFGIVTRAEDHTPHDILLRRYLCPWEWPKAHTFARACLPLVSKDRAGNVVIVTEAETVDEQPIRTLFEDSYKEYWKDYPVIRKMAKGVLNNDLAPRRGVVSAFGHAHPRSAIADFYQKRGGIFLVALRYMATGSTRQCRQVIGFVGVRLCEGEGRNVGDTLELFRLVVDSNHRGLGVGRKLLDAVELFARAVKGRKLVAKTLTILKSASRLYEAFGFRGGQESALNATLTTLPYEKQLDDRDDVDDDDPFWSLALQNPEDSKIMTGSSYNDNTVDDSNNETENDMPDNLDKLARLAKFSWYHLPNTTTTLELAPLVQEDGICGPLGSDAWYASALLTAMILEDSKNTDTGGMYGILPMTSQSLWPRLSSSNGAKSFFRVLELGSGAVGLSGLACAAAIAQHPDSSPSSWQVCLTDNDPDVLQQLKLNVRQNLSKFLQLRRSQADGQLSIGDSDSDEKLDACESSPVQVCDLDWGAAGDLAREGEAPHILDDVDVVIGSELVYTEETAKALLKVLFELLRRNASLTIWIVQVTDRFGWNEIVLPTLEEDPSVVVNAVSIAIETHQAASKMIPMGGTLDHYAYGAVCISKANAAADRLMT